MSVISVVVTTLCKAHVGGICNLFCVVTLLQCKATNGGLRNASPRNVSYSVTR